MNAFRGRRLLSTSWVQYQSGRPGIALLQGWRRFLPLGTEDSFRHPTYTTEGAKPSPYPLVALLRGYPSEPVSESSPKTAPEEI